MLCCLLQAPVELRIELIQLVVVVRIRFHCREVPMRVFDERHVHRRCDGQELLETIFSRDKLTGLTLSHDDARMA